MEDNNGNGIEVEFIEEDEEDIDPTTLDLTSIVNISFPPTSETLFAILRAHNDRARTLVKMAEDRKKGVKVNDLDAEVRAEIKKQAASFDTSNLVDTFNTLIYGDDDENGLAVLMACYQAVESVRTDLKDAIDHFVYQEVKRVKAERNITETGDETFAREKATCKALFDMLKLQTEMVKMLNGGEKWEAPEGLYRADTERTLFNIVEPPKGSGKRERGSNAVERKVQYTLNGSNLPLGISLNELCFEYLSTSTFRMTRKRLDALLKENDIQTVANNDKGWEVKLPNGVVLGGKLVK